MGIHIYYTTNPQDALQAMAEQGATRRVGQTTSERTSSVVTWSLLGEVVTWQTRLAAACSAIARRALTGISGVVMAVMYGKQMIILRYYNIDPPGLLESTNPHTYHCSYGPSIPIEDP